MNNLGKVVAKFKESAQGFKDYQENIENSRIDKKKKELEVLKKRTVKKVELAKIQEEIDELKKFEEGLNLK